MKRSKRVLAISLVLAALLTGATLAVAAFGNAQGGFLYSLFTAPLMLAYLAGTLTSGNFHRPNTFVTYMTLFAFYWLISCAMAYAVGRRHREVQPASQNRSGSYSARMFLQKWDADAARLIEALRSELAVSNADDTRFLRAALPHSDGYPVYIDMGTYLIVQPDGELVALDLESFAPLDIAAFDDHPEWLLHALERARHRVPVLASYLQEGTREIARGGTE